MMKILWIANCATQEAVPLFNLSKFNTGGWISSLADLIKEKHGIKLYIAFPGNTDTLVQKEKNGIVYFSLPIKNINAYDHSLEFVFLQIKKDVQPDVVHIHGSEFPHGLAWLNGCGSRHVLLTIQGIQTAYNRYFFGGIPESELKKYRTFHDRIRSSVFSEYRRLQNYYAPLEKEIFARVSHIGGRTSWDRAYSKAWAPAAQYHFCGEMLRPVFYTDEKWNIGKMKKHTVFLSQAARPLKGLHTVFKALPYVLKKNPDTKVRIAGNDIFTLKTWKQRLSLATYPNYIRHLIKDLHLENNVEFCGPLNAEQMRLEYLHANVFICSSAIENSPNSLAEAQISGIPLISSYCGGVPDMVEDGKTGLLYRFEEIEMLAELILRLFSSPELCQTLSRQEIASASVRHERNSILSSLISVYKEICRDV